VNLVADGMLAPPQLAASLNKRGGGPTTTTTTTITTPSSSSSASTSSSNTASISSSSAASSASSSSASLVAHVTSSTATSFTTAPLTVDSHCYPPNLANQFVSSTNNSNNNNNNNNHFQIKSNNFHDYRAAADTGVSLTNRTNTSKVFDLNYLIEDNIINDFEKLQVKNLSTSGSSANVVTSLLDIHSGQYQAGGKFTINTDLTASMLMDKAKQKCEYNRKKSKFSLNVCKQVV
jgi:hypothetical protein